MTYSDYKIRMRILLIVTLSLLFMSWALSQRSQGDSFVAYYTAPDKVLHITAGFATTGLATHWHFHRNPDGPIINSAGFGFLMGAGAGGFKEIFIDDIGGMGQADAGDFYATAMGAAVSAFVNAAILKWSRKRYDKKRNPPKTFDENWNLTAYGTR